MTWGSWLHRIFISDLGGEATSEFRIIIQNSSDSTENWLVDNRLKFSREMGAADTGWIKAARILLIE